jgi:DNA (cytosine-5)-methyltransferase 1
LNSAALRPSFGEQVASKDGFEWLDLVQSDLEGTGYACWPVDLCAAGIGAPRMQEASADVTGK